MLRLLGAHRQPGREHFSAAENDRSIAMGAEIDDGESNGSLNLISRLVVQSLPIGLLENALIAVLIAFPLIT
jgi:hypothetical protein